MATADVIPDGKTKKRAILMKHPFLFFGLLVVLTIAILLLCIRAAQSPAPPAAQLNQAAVKLASDVLVEDLDTGLLGGRSLIATLPGENLLAWAGLDRKATAKKYEAAYDNNEIAADNEYKGKKILLSGTVARVEKDFAGNGQVWLQGLGIVGHSTKNSK